MYISTGTTGLPKGVLATQRSWLTNVINVSKICVFYLHVLKGQKIIISSQRAALRRGEDVPVPLPGPQKSMLISVPFFHVTGSTSLAVWQPAASQRQSSLLHAQMLATMAGLRIILMRKWDIQEGSVSNDIFRPQSFTSLQLRGICFNLAPSSTGQSSLMYAHRLIKEEHVAIAGGCVLGRSA